MQKKWVTILVTTVGVASGIAAILTYFRSPTPTTSVQASGNAIAAGNDVRIGERTTIDKHDFDDDRRQHAEAYLSVARDSCKSVSARIESMTADSSVDLTQMQRFYPPEMHPTQIVAEHYGEQVYRDITAKLEETLRVYQVAVKPLMENSIRSMTGFAARPQDKARKAAAFATDKQAWLGSTNDLCRYLDSVGS